MGFVIERAFLDSFFDILYSCIGYSSFYEKPVIVEPVAIIVRAGDDRLVNCLDLTSRVYGIDNLGDHVASRIDEEAGGYIEQAFCNFRDFIFICDNPIVFPHDRLNDLRQFLRDNKAMQVQTGGIIHYHVDEPFLNEDDVEALKRFSQEMKEEGVHEIVGLVISQRDPREALSLMEQGAKPFKEKLFKEYHAGSLTLAGKLFRNHSVGDIELVRGTG